MATLFSSRKLCPTCGKPLSAVPEDVAAERQRYVCTHCDTDPMHDPAARRWADSPLRPPAK